jgi:hypothetical protein
MHFSSDDVPVAYGMLGLITGRPPNANSPFDTFCCLWMAFNSIYAKLAQAGPNAPQLTGRMRRIGAVEVPEVKPGFERKQIDAAIERMSAGAKHRIITALETRWFVERTPTLRRPPKKLVKTQYPMNGVLNLGYTMATHHEIWTPIDTIQFKSYAGENDDPLLQNMLVKQIVGVIYTVRNNTFHGGKLPEDENARDVVSRATELLKIIIADFLDPSAVQ